MHKHNMSKMKHITIYTSYTYKIYYNTILCIVYTHIHAYITLMKSIYIRHKGDASINMPT